MKRAGGRAAGRPPVRRRLDHARRVPGEARGARRRTERRVLRRRDHGARATCSASDDVQPTAGRARADARPRATGDGGRRAGRRLVADLRAGQLREDRRARRAVTEARPLRRHVHHAHAQRGRPALEAVAGDDRDRARDAARPAEIYHLKAAGEVELGQARRGHRDDRRGARARACASAPTCTPTSAAPPASTPRCRPGCRTAASRPGSSACATRRSARASIAEMRDPAPAWENLLLARRRRRHAAARASRTRS